jgi:hypothetical protein
MYKRHAELVNSTPFDLTFQDKINSGSRNQINELLNIVKQTIRAWQARRASTHELTTTIKTVEKSSRS